MPHLLLIDDEPAICKLVRLLLEPDKALRVSTAPDTARALHIMERDQPDVALVDVVLPDGSGLELANTMTDLGIHVLMFTGDPDSQRRLSAAGIPFLPKPFQIEQFFTATRALFERAGDLLHASTAEPRATAAPKSRRIPRKKTA